MSVIFRNTQVPIFIKIERNIINNISDILVDENIKYNNALIVSNDDILNLDNINIESSFKDIKKIKDNALATAKDLGEEVIKNKFDLIIAMGGGQILDMAKYAATQADINYISVPTTPSHDGIASPISVLTNNDGLKESIGVNMPTGIIVDLEIIKNAPLDNIKAGTGDLLSNFSALADWKLAKKEKNEKMDDFAASLAYSAADLIYGNIVNGFKIDLTSKKFLKTLVNGLILSGIAMHISKNSRPCSGAEHKISHAIDKLFPNTAMHGQQVALGIIIAEKLRDSEYFESYKKLFTNIELPTSYKDLGLSEEQMIEVLKYASQTRPDRYTILEKIDLDDNKIKQIINEL